MMCSSKDSMNTTEGQNRAMNNYSVCSRCSYDTCQSTVAFYELSLKSFKSNRSQKCFQKRGKIFAKSTRINLKVFFFPRDYNPLTTVFFYFSHKEFSFSIISIITVFSFFFFVYFVSVVLFGSVSRKFSFEIRNFPWEFHANVVKINGYLEVLRVDLPVRILTSRFIGVVNFPSTSSSLIYLFLTWSSRANNFSFGPFQVKISRRLKRKVWENKGKLAAREMLKKKS